MAVIRSRKGGSCLHPAPQGFPGPVEAYRHRAFGEPEGLGDVGMAEVLQVQRDHLSLGQGKVFQGEAELFAEGIRGNDLVGARGFRGMSRIDGLGGPATDHAADMPCPDVVGDPGDQRPMRGLATEPWERPAEGNGDILIQVRAGVWRSLIG